MGSKNRHAKHLLPIILKNRTSGQYYVEPFAGGMNMIDKVIGKRIANDINTPLICFFNELVYGGLNIPDQITDIEYNNSKKLPDQDPLKGFIGFGCSFSGKYFGGFARGNDSKGIPRNYCLESKRNCMNQKLLLHGVIFYNLRYNELQIPFNSIIYCDPPYENSTDYKTKFDHAEFWQWCRSMKNIGHTIYISEYNAPEDFICLWSKKVNSSLTKNTGSKKAVEKLYTI